LLYHFVYFQCLYIMRNCLFIWLMSGSCKCCN
jgi:hypothetical protein